VALTLAWARGLAGLDRAVKAGIWSPSSASLRRVSSLTAGVLGFGAIGRRTAAKLAALGVRVLVHTRSYRGGEGADAATLDDLLAASDAVLINLPLTEETHHLFDDVRLGRMKPGAFLVNVSRGPIVDNAALLRRPGVLLTHTRPSRVVPLIELRCSFGGDVVLVGGAGLLFFGCRTDDRGWVSCFRT